MCMVSMIMDYGRRDFWPSVTATEWPTTPTPPVPPTVPPKHLKKFLELWEKAKEYDETTNQPDCEDPKKLEVLEEVLKALQRIEKKLK